jgi:hypothetical protein
MVTGDTFLAIMENTALCHVRVGAVFLLDDAPLYFSHRVCAFPNREFPDDFVGGEGLIHLPLVVQHPLVWIYFGGGCEKRCLS